MQIWLSSDTTVKIQTNHRLDETLPSPLQLETCIPHIPSQCPGTHGLEYHLNVNVGGELCYVTFTLLLVGASKY